MMRKMILFFIMIVPMFASVSYSLSQERVANAQTILFEIYTDEPIDKAYVSYLGKRYPFYKHPSKMQGEYYALVPTGYYEKPKQKDAIIVSIQEGQKTYIPVAIMIAKGKYKSERLKVKPSKARFSKKDSARIKREADEAKKIYSVSTAKSYISEAFVKPLHSKITSLFGNRRVFMPSQTNNNCS